jgi:hypothetical protein
VCQIGPGAKKGPYWHRLPSNGVSTISLYTEKTKNVKHKITLEALEMEGLTMAVEETIKIAKASRKNGNSTKREREQALRAAQAADVTNLDYLRGRIFLEIAGGNVQTVKGWLEDMEPGNIRDNSAAVEIALYRIRTGDVEAGQAEIRRVQDRIRKTGEAKSVTLLLPIIDAALTNTRG